MMFARRSGVLLAVLILTAATAWAAPPRYATLPIAGEKVTLHVPVGAGVDYQHYHDYWKAEIAHDRVGVEELRKTGWVERLDAGTEILVIKNWMLDFQQREYLEVVAAGRTERNDPAPCEVRVLSGPSRDEVRYLHPDDLVVIHELPPAPVPVPAPVVAPAPVPVVRTRSDRAATALTIAENLARSHKSDAALKAYRAVIHDYPDTPQASIAAERLKIKGR